MFPALDVFKCCKTMFCNRLFLFVLLFFGSHVCFAIGEQKFHLFIDKLKEGNITSKARYVQLREVTPELQKFAYDPVVTYKNFGFSWQKLRPEAEQVENLFIQRKVTPGNYVYKVENNPDLIGFPLGLRSLSLLYPRLNWARIMESVLPLKTFIDLAIKHKLSSANYVEKTQSVPELKNLPTLGMLKTCYPGFHWGLINFHSEFLSNKSMEKDFYYEEMIRAFKERGIYFQNAYEKARKTDKELKKFPYRPEDTFKDKKFQWSQVAPSLREMEDLFIRLQVTHSRYEAFVSHHPELRGFPRTIVSFSGKYPQFSWSRVMNAILPMKDLISLLKDNQVNSENYQAVTGSQAHLSHLPSKQMLSTCYPEFKWEMVTKIKTPERKHTRYHRQDYERFLGILKRRKIYYKTHYMRVQKTDRELKPFPVKPESSFKHFGFQWSRVKPATSDIENLFMDWRVSPGNYEEAVQQYPVLAGFPKQLNSLIVKYPDLDWAKVLRSVYPMELFIQTIIDFNINYENYSEHRNKNGYLVMFPSLKTLYKIYPGFEWRGAHKLRLEVKSKRREKMESLSSPADKLLFLCKEKYIYSQSAYLEARKTDEELKSFPSEPERFYGAKNFNWDTIHPSKKEIERLFVKLGVTPVLYDHLVKQYYLLRSFPKTYNTFNNKYPYISWENIMKRILPMETFIEILRDNGLNSKNYPKMREINPHLHHLPSISTIKTVFPHFSWSLVDGSSEKCFNVFFPNPGLKVIDFPQISRK